MTPFEELQQAIIDGKAPVAKQLTEKMLKDGIRPGEFFPRRSFPPWMRWGGACGNVNFSFPKC